MKPIFPLFLKQELLSLLVAYFSLAYVHGQESKVLYHFQDAFKNYEQAYAHLDQSLSLLEKAFLPTHSPEEMATWIRRSQAEMHEGYKKMTKAAESASRVEDYADERDCDQLEEDSDDAADYFYEAKREVRKAKKAADRALASNKADDLSRYIERASSYLIEAIQRLYRGVDKLEDAKRRIGGCDEDEF